MYEIRIDRGIDAMIWHEVEYMTIAPECLKLWIIGAEKIEIVPIMTGDKINIRWVDNVYT